MIVNSTHQKIDALRKIMPDGFVFVLDTTDRSFLYKSKNSPDCEQVVISLDKIQGIDLLTKNRSAYTYQGDNQIIKLQRIGGHTFLGICAPKNSFSEDRLSLADNYIV
ncbi:hypothetical protein [Ekhidna sp.]|uniref:hypothetical protein n=1 Tax=Ekhidna sp. TaxID=2608089 RepID=UPI003CCBB7B9